MLSVNIIAGFLGAGKTTLLMRILKSGLKGERAAVIVNEFGQVGVDGEIIGKEGYRMVELVSGCICCTLQTDLYTAVCRMIDEINPDRLIIEATGIARPADIAKALRWEPLNSRTRIETIVDVIDVSRFGAFRERMGEFYEEQASTADVILLNKRDLADEETLESVRHQVCELNPGAVIIPTEHCDLDTSLLLSPPPRISAGDDLAHSTSRTEQRTTEDHEEHHEAAEGFETFTYEASAPLDRERFLEFISSLPEKVVRVKGFVRFTDGVWLLNCASGDHTLEPTDHKGGTRLVFTGRGMDKPLIMRGLEDLRTE